MLAWALVLSLLPVVGLPLSLLIGPRWVQWRRLRSSRSRERVLDEAPARCWPTTPRLPVRPP
jgi:hypothetical protein